MKSLVMLEPQQEVLDTAKSVSTADHACINTVSLNINIGSEIGARAPITLNGRGRAP